MRLVKNVMEYHECEVLKWSNKRFIEQLHKFRERITVMLQNYLHDYSEIGPISDILAEYQFYSSSEE